MSIIYDALKKNQDNPQPEGPKLDPLPKKNPKTKKPFPLRFLLIAIIAIALLSWIVANAQKQAKEANKKYFFPRGAKTLSPAQALETMIKKTSPNRSYNFILEGIVSSKGSYTALINGHICNTGDTIENAKIEEITADQVTLTHQGQKITLGNK